MVTGFDDDTTWGYDAALGYDEERRREARQRYEEQQRYAASDVRPASFGAPPPGAPAPGAPSPGAPSPGAPSPGVIGTAGSGTASAGQVWRAATTAGPVPAEMTDEMTAVMTEAGAGEAGKRPHPARLVLGMATLAAERLRGGAPSSDALATGVGRRQKSRRAPATSPDGCWSRPPGSPTTPWTGPR